MDLHCVDVWVDHTCSIHMRVAEYLGVIEQVRYCQSYHTLTLYDEDSDLVVCCPSYFR